MKSLSGKKVKVDLGSSVGLGRIDGNRLYGPGENIEVPVELAQALGKTGTSVETTAAAGAQGGAGSQSGSDGGGGTAFRVKLQNNTAVSVVMAGEPSADFPTAEEEITAKTVDELEAELAIRKINLPNEKGSGASGGYLKDDLVRVLVATAATS